MFVYVHVCMYVCINLLIQHKLNRYIFCCVEWTSLVFLDAACYPDVAFHIPTDGRDGSSSCYATALSVRTCKLKYEVNFVISA